MSAAARRARRSLPQVTTLLFGLFSIWPLLQARTTCSDDGVFHMHKALGLEAAIQLGHWFPRWSPHMAHGFGYPLYNFYAPLGSYMLAGLHALGFIYPLALHIALALCILLAGLAVFALVRDWWGPWAGLAAAVVYQTSPYLAFNILFRGALAETLALVWLPLILWTLDRALRRESLRWGALATLCFAALIYTHNASALLATPLIAGYAAFISGEQRRRQLLARAAAIMLAGLALSAHFWMPALAERGLVQTEQLLVPPVFTYYTNFLTSAELLAPPVATQPRLINPSPPKALGAIAAGMALLGTATVTLRPARADTRRPKRGAARPLFFFGALLLYGALTLPLTRTLWDALPLLPFVQFPWRMLGVATLCAATLAGAAVRWLASSNRSWVAAAVIATVATLGHLSWWYPRYCAEFAEATIGTMLEYEYNTFTVGTSAKGEFLPKTVRYLPQENTLAEALQAGDTPERLHGLPAGATLDILDPDPLDFRATLRTPEAFSAAYQMFYYLGWRVSVDGQPRPLEVAAGTGLIKFEVPAGEHELRVYFGVTPLRALASSIAVAALLATIAALLAASPRPAACAWRHARAPALLLALPLALLAAKLLLIDRSDNAFQRTSIEAASLGTPLAVSLDNGLDTLAYSVRPDPVPSGGTFEVVLYLTPRSTPQRDYRPLFRLQSVDNLIWNINPHETVPPRWHREPPRTQYWPVEEYAQFARQYQLLPGTPPGEYRLYGTFFDYATLETSKAVTPEGVPQTDRIDLGTVKVVRPPTPASAAALEMQIETGTRLTPEITLLGGSADRRQAGPGGLMTVTLFFHAQTAPSSDEHITLALGGTDFALRLDPTPGFPTSQWRTGDVWRGQHLLRLPADLPDGEHSWTVRASSEGSAITYLVKLRVTAPERIFEPPKVIHPVRLAFGNDILLSGYDWSQPQAHPGEVLEIRLLWHALATPTEDVSVFVHLESLAGELVTQHDGVPLNWTRPSAGWVAGEYVDDPHAFTIPVDAQPGAYRLHAGLVDRVTGERLPITGAGEHTDSRALLGLLTVIP